MWLRIPIRLMLVRNDDGRKNPVGGATGVWYTRRSVDGRCIIASGGEDLAEGRVAGEFAFSGGCFLDQAFDHFV